MPTRSPVDLFLPHEDCNPYPVYAELRESNGGVHYAEPVDMWVFLRYQDGQRLSQERQRWSSDHFGIMTGQFTRGDPVHERYAAVMARNLMLNDAPDHTRLRKLLNHAFAGRVTKTWDPVIENVVDRVLSSIPQGVSVDFFHEIAEVIPVEVVSTLIGVPVADREQFRKLSVSFAATFDPTIQGEQLDRCIRDSVELMDYIENLARDLAKDREGKGGHGLLATLITAEEDGSKLSMEELVANVGMLLVAGNETTADLISTGVGLLVGHPDQFALLRAEPSLVDSALLEILRYEAPLQFSPRLAADNIDIDGGRTIPKGSKVLFGHGSGNRDPRQFDRPDVFDIRRNDRHHLAFAAGPHFCIGNALALAEGRVFFHRLLERFGTIESAGAAKWREGRLIQRGFDYLPVALSA